LNILVLATSFPANEKDISGKFIKDQIQNLKFYHNDFSFHILVGNRSKHSFKNESKDYILHKFRYFIKKLEIIGNEDIKVQLGQNKAIYLLIPFYFLGQLISTFKLVIKNKIDKIHVHWFMPQAYVAFLVKKIYKIPYNITIHSSEVIFFVNRFKLIGKYISKKILLDAGKIWVTSNNTKDTLKKIFSDEEMEDLKIIVSPMGLNTNFLENIKENKILNSDSTKNILYVGRFVEKKGVINLIKAFQKIHTEILEYKLILAGYGHLKFEIENLVKKLKLNEKVVILDKVNENQKKQLFKLSEILVIPSGNQKNDVEGMPVVILEGLYYEVLVLATKSTFCEQVINNEENGFIINSNEPKELAKKLKKIINIEEKIKIQIKQNAKKSSLGYSSENSSIKYKEFLS
tara:strand:+ start:8187 stop:9395 length:1209 start_codon:yes stop_codon:yes gene_type:complete